MKYTFKVKSASREFSVHVHEHSLLPGLLPNFAAIKVEDEAWNQSDWSSGYSPGTRIHEQPTKHILLLKDKPKCYTQLIIAHGTVQAIPSLISCANWGD